jgi:MFS family permease
MREWVLIDAREFHLTDANSSTLNSNSTIHPASSQPVLTITVVSVLQAGCFFGSLIAYYVADRWGRKVKSLLVGRIITKTGVSARIVDFS